MSFRGSYCAALLFIWVGAGCGHNSKPRGIPRSVEAVRAPGQATSSEADKDAKSEEANPALRPPAKKKVWLPSVQTWRPEIRVSGRYTLEDQAESVAEITAYRVPLYGRPGDKYEIGRAYRGAMLPATPVASSRRCRGRWYKVSGGAYLCSGDGARILDEDELKRPIILGRGIDLDRALPFSYVKADRGAPRLEKAPSSSEVDLIKAGKTPRSLVDRWLEGTYLLAAVSSKTVGSEEVLRTPDDRWVLKPQTQPKPLPPMHGVSLAARGGLPLAFLHAPAPVLCATDDDSASWTECGELQQHARFIVHGEQSGAQEMVMIDEERAVRRRDVRLVERIDRPKGVSAKDKWIHVNLSEQTLVAYEGDRPVYATLVSTGKPGYETENGLFRVDRKFVSKTMRGKDEDGPYSVGEVPWTMYYDGNYALHGAYWHNEFGGTRSHGCINIPPIDARWLFLWDTADLPAGWYAMFHREGAFVYITGKTPKGNGK